MIKDVNFSKKTKYDLKPFYSIDIVVCFFKHCYSLLDNKKKRENMVEDEFFWPYANLSFFT